MDKNDMQHLLEEIEGRANLGMGDEALELCRKALDSPQALTAEFFAEILSTVGVFAADMREWVEPLKAAFEALDEEERDLVRTQWCSWLATAQADWEHIKSELCLMNLKEISEVDFLMIVEAGCNANDTEWTRTAKQLAGNFCMRRYAGDLALARLETHAGDHEAALRSLRGAMVDEVFLETYADILTDACLGLFTKELDRLASMVGQAASAMPDAEIEMQAPGNNAARYEELLQRIERMKAGIRGLRGTEDR